ncbi:hypothetical protein ACSSS7_000421 [Eimeria intestinalis]
MLKSSSNSSSSSSSNGSSSSSNSSSGEEVSVRCWCMSWAAAGGRSSPHDTPPRHVPLLPLCLLPNKSLEGVKSGATPAAALRILLLLLLLLLLQRGQRLASAAVGLAQLICGACCSKGLFDHTATQAAAAATGQQHQQQQQQL